MRRADAIAAETKAEAAAWLARLHADDRSLADEGAFQIWVGSRPENARAFEAVTALWDLADGLRGELPLAADARPLLRRRTVLASMGSLIAAGAGFGIWEQAYAGVYETDIGEQKHVMLRDGTEVFLDTDSRIRERYVQSVRRVQLDRGRADFRVKPETERAFVVESAGQRILANSARFDVRRDGSRVSIVLLEGRATVIADVRGATHRLALNGGQRLVVADNMVRVDNPDLARLTAWQTGQAIFEGESLAEAAAEMNRYSTMRLETGDPVVGRFKLSGVYRVGDNDGFARSVSQLLPVVIERYPDHIELVRDESRMPEG